MFLLLFRSVLSYRCLQIFKPFDIISQLYVFSVIIYQEKYICVQEDDEPHIQPNIDYSETKLHLFNYNRVHSKTIVSYSLLSLILMYSLRFVAWYGSPSKYVAFGVFFVSIENRKPKYRIFVLYAFHHRYEIKST